ncbi:MAG: YcaO-like family protein [Candidatus Heimdallarchaeota archaeon]
MKLQATQKNSHFKSDEYKNTIHRIITGFNRINMKLKFSDWCNNPKINCYSCKLNIQDLNVSSFGKGTTKEQAMASALGEITERFSSNFYFKHFENKYNGNNGFTEKFDEFKNYNNMPGYVYKSEAEIQGDKLKIEKLFRRFTFLTKKFYDKIKNFETSKHWITGFSLIDAKNINVPISVISKISGSNGLASGNTIEEAIVQASEEIFERYTAIEIVKNELIVPTFDKNTIKNKKLNTMIKKIEKKNIEVIIKDFSLGIFPTIGVLFVNHNIRGDANKILLDFSKYMVHGGSAFNKEQALTRCITERLVGSRFKNFINGGFHLPREFFEKFTYKEYDRGLVNLFRKYQTNVNLSFLLKGELMSFPEEANSNDFLQDIIKIKGICKSLNEDIIVINHTHPIIRFPTVRVIIPTVSDVLSINDISSEEQLTNLLMSCNSSIDFKTSEKFLTTDVWLDDEKEILILINDIINKFQNYLTFDIVTYGMFYNKKNGLMLLASLFYKIKDYNNFANCCEIIYKSYSNSDYYYLSHMTKRYLKTKDEEYLQIIQAKLEKMKGCERYLIKQPLQNPLLTWCDEECNKKCPSRYVAKFNEAINSFYA